MVQWDENALGITAAEVDDLLMSGDPRIAVSRAEHQGIELTVFMNDRGDEKIAVRRLRRSLDRAQATGELPQARVRRAEVPSRV